MSLTAQERVELLVTAPDRFGARAASPCRPAPGGTPRHDEPDLDLRVEGLPPGQYHAALAPLREVLADGLGLDPNCLEPAPARLAPAGF